jgi:hypothetical protein
MLSTYSSPVRGRAVVLADGLIAGCGTTIVPAAAVDVSLNVVVGVIGIFASFAKRAWIDVANGIWGTRGWMA